MKKIFLFLAVIIVIAPACERFDHYDAPDWLQGPLFEQIKSTGEFNEFVKIAERTGYDKFLSSRLTFTFFLPTDEAFREYYQEKNVSGPEQISEEELLALMQFHTLLYSWDSLRMGGKTTWGYWTRNANNFRTLSYYAPPIQQEREHHVFNDNTFLHVFSNQFMTLNGLNALDYESFHPGSTWTGYHVNRASIIEKELGAENGFYYVIDKVLHPRTTADKMIAEREEFSLFKQLLDIFVRYNLDANRSAASSEYDELYRKVYALNFNLANERITTSDPDGYYQVISSMFIPDNQTIMDYFAETFPAYQRIEDVPPIIIKYFLEAHMVTNKKLFPSVLERPEKETNDFSDIIPYTLNNGINYQAMASNALIYGVDRVIHSNAFSTVSGPIISNPKYRIFTMMLELSDEIRSFFRREIGHVTIVLSDELMTELGFNYSEGNPADFTDDVIFRNNNQLTRDHMRSFLENFISLTSKNVDGQKETYIRTKSNRYLHIGDGKVSGLFGEGNIVNIYETTNGTVIEVDKDLSTSVNFTIEDYLNNNKDQFSRFFQLAQQAGMLDGTGNIGSISLFQGITLLLPTNEAINAITGSYIPENLASGDFNARNFIQYHLISERAIFTDDVFPEANYGTDLFLNSVRQRINVFANGSEVRITDLRNNTQTIVSGAGKNIITSNGVIHIVDHAVQH